MRSDDARLKAGLRTAHGHARRGERSGEFTSWLSMRRRCLDPHNNRYKNYGGKGVQICAQWADSFEAFLRDMGPKPTPQHSIERINVDGNYGPDNCRWATAKEQANNTRRNITITFNGETKTLSEWAASSHIHYHTLKKRYHMGWDPHRMFNEPVLIGRRHIGHLL